MRVVVFALAGCNVYKNVVNIAVPPKAKVESVSVLSETSDGTQLSAAVVLTNPNDVPLSLFEATYSINIGGNDTLADNLYLFNAILPSATTATSSTNTLITVAWDPADASAAEDFDEFTNGGNLSSIGQLSLTVWGA